jgi:dihydroxyacid dehydratase/phosphogluconate dehydratase
VVDEQAVVAMVALLATGGSTNHLIVGWRNRPVS